ncbi:MAG: metallophosphoesterase [Sulfurimonas sp.]|nr:metallophosphoesterase [Sulfurimonas sp.]
MNPVLFFITFFSVFILLNFYISKRLIKKLDISDKAKNYLNIFLIINLLGIVGYILARYYIDTSGWLYFILSLPIGIVFLLFCTTLFYDLFRIFIQYSPISDSRRKFFKKSLDVFSLVTASGLGIRSLYEAKNVKLEEVHIKIKKLKKAYTIVQLSDLHISPLIDKAYMNNVVNIVNNINADIVVITGDLIDTADAEDTLYELTKLKSKYGTYFIVGNHEYFHNIEKSINLIKSLGIKVLENENIYIGEDNNGFNLAGVYDLFGYRVKKYIPNLNKALLNRKDSPTILLAHQPKFISEVKDGVDLMLSGHTHGGQIYPFKFLVKLQQPYVSGLHKHNENLQIYVNRGTGFWGPPMRLGVSSEITKIFIEP